MKYIGYLPLLALLPTIRKIQIGVPKNYAWEELKEYASKHPKSSKVYATYKKTCVRRMKENSKRKYKRIHDN